MRNLSTALLTLALTACGDRYNDDGHGTYGNGPLVTGGCGDAAGCATQASQASNSIKASDPNFEKNYARGVALDQFLQDYLVNGHQTKARARILKVRTVGNKMRAFVSLTDSAGNPTADAAAADLRFSRVRASGEKELLASTVVGPVYGRLPIQMSAVLDHSGSMSGSIDALHAATVQLVAALPEVAFSIVKFATTANIVQPMTKDFAALSAAIRAPYELSSTALFDAIAVGLDSHGGSGADLEALTLGMVFTDGVENASKIGYDVVKSRLREARIPQLIIGMGQVDIKSLLTMAEDTNGLFQYQNDAAKIEASMAYAAATVKAVIEVEIPLSDAPDLKAEDLVADIRE